MSVLVKALHSEGYKAAVSHFDRRGAVRTNASWSHVAHLLTKRFGQKNVWI